MHAPVMGLDYGLRRIGVAVGSHLSGSGTPVITLAAQHGQPDWHQLSELVKTWRPACAVVGLPHYADGSPHPLAAPIHAFRQELMQRYNLEVYTIDEHLSSTAAAQRLGRSGRGRHHSAQQQDIDRMSAVIILETWFALGHDHGS